MRIVVTVNGFLHGGCAVASVILRSRGKSVLPVLLLLLGLLAGLNQSALAGGTPAKPPVLIVYDSWQQIPHPSPDDIKAPDSSLADSLQLEQLLGHFPMAADRMRLADYRPGTLTQYPFVFYIGNLRKAVLPRHFLRDVGQYRGSFYWINYAIGQLDPAALKKFGISFVRLEIESSFNKVRYHGVELEKGDPTTNIIQVTAPQNCTIVAETIPDKGTTTPYITRTGNFWYIADSPFSYMGERDRYFAFADTLYDFFGVQPKVRKRAILRIEDVNPTTPPGALRDIADRLSRLHAPFAISLIPRYQNPNTKVEIPTASRPDYLNAVHYMTTHGGSVLMHGWTHRYHGVTADDFEFWNGDANARTPTIPEDSPEYVDTHLHNGLDDCFDARLYPIAWETPHYAASMIDYAEISRHFSTAVEQRILLDHPEFSQYFPFVIKRDIYGQKIYPENLGYITMQVNDDKKEDLAKEEAEVDEILANAKDLGVLRDVTVGAFIHPFLNTSLVSRLVEGLQKEGYTFIDLRNENNTVQLDDMLIATGSVHGQIKLEDQYIHEFFLDPEGRVKKESYSKTKYTGVLKRSMKIPDGWIYVCHGVRSRPPSWLTQTKRNVIAALKRFPMRGASEREVPKEPARTVVLTLAKCSGAVQHDQNSYLHALDTMGTAPETLAVADLSTKTLEPFNVLVVPQACAGTLTPAQITLISKEVSNGLNILLDGTSQLSEALGVKASGKTETVATVRDQLTFQALTWPSAASVPVCTFPTGATAIYKEPESNQTVAAYFPVHRGHCLVMTTTFDPSSEFGYSRFPTLPTAFFTAFPVIPAFTAHDLELFFEPGDRTSISIEKLVLEWKKWGVRAIHAGCWHFYSNYTYDYDRLIRNCHANGIAVYAWLELPYVSRKFYEAHPEWHEKTAAGIDSQPGWRMPVAIEEPQCRKAVLDFVADLLKQHDWDGVNLSELYFENLTGPDDAKQFVPMHPYVRTTFKQRYKFDPVELCQPGSAHYWRTHPGAWKQFADFRGELLRDVYRDVLHTLQGFQHGDQLGRRDVVVTALDTINNPEIQRNTGLDIRDIIGMMAGKGQTGERFDFVLNVEDPQRRWNDSPDRYVALGKQYAKLVADPAKLALDLNIVNVHKQGDHRFATLIPIGLETLEMLHSARSVVPRVILYSESTLSPFDTGLLGSASASAGYWQECPDGYQLKASGMVYLRGQNEDHQITIGHDTLLVNDLGEAALPAGEYKLQIHEDLLQLAADIPVIRLLSTTGNLRHMNEHHARISLDYDAAAPCLFSFDERPEHITLDDKPWAAAIMEGNHCWTLRCPSGAHSLVVSSQGISLFLAQEASAISAWVIVLFGGGASVMLLLLILITHIGRIREMKQVKGQA